ncbi:MAG TPA: helix-turn-helix domain-containing protein [Trebonia sp.]|nr:helix-turn-helix domain-containing protein [Trebonia sp.]
MSLAEIEIEIVPALLTPEEASAYIGGAYSPQRLKRLAGQHRVTHVRIGRFARFRRPDLDSLIGRNVCDSANYGRKPTGREPAGSMPRTA